MKKIYFNEGETVRLKDLEGPIMKVRKVVRGRRLDDDGESKTILVGIECEWFEREEGESMLPGVDYDYRLMREVFNTKDLVHIEL